MWIGLLTQGTHPCRPAASEGLATLFAWGRRERSRIDGLQAEIAAGVRMMRRTQPATLGPAYEPRCFDCRRPYLIPDPVQVRAQDDIVELGSRADPDDDADDDDDDDPDCESATSVDPKTVRAVFALVHVEDTAAVGDEGEALVYVPGTSLVVLIPLDCLPDHASMLTKAGPGFLPVPCDGCGTPAPGGTLSEPNRASRRLAARRRGGGRRAA
ncbi:MAG: hypothetical protein JWN65_4246 [Solirubrobacterales bacterium]|nr:hypothetical protein [Solirubrobacterales bacterium]